MYLISANKVQNEYWKCSQYFEQLVIYHRFYLGLNITHYHSICIF